MKIKFNKFIISFPILNKKTVFFALDFSFLTSWFPSLAELKEIFLILILFIIIGITYNAVAYNVSQLADYLLVGYSGLHNYKTSPQLVHLPGTFR